MCRVRVQKKQDNPVQAGAVIIDEVSMLDVVLKSLMDALKTGTRLVLVGRRQSASVRGAGNVMEHH